MPKSSRPLGMVAFSHFSLRVNALPAHPKTAKPTLYPAPEPFFCPPRQLHPLGRPLSRI